MRAKGRISSTKGGRSHWRASLPISSSNFISSLCNFPSLQGSTSSNFSKKQIPVIHINGERRVEEFDEAEGGDFIRRLFVDEETILHSNGSRFFFFCSETQRSAEGSSWNKHQTRCCSCEFLDPFRFRFLFFFQLLHTLPMNFDYAFSISSFFSSGFF